jgi:hypothetical protein
MKFQVIGNNIGVDLLLDTLRAKFEEIGLERLSAVSLYCAGGKMEYKLKVDRDKLLLQESTEEELRDIRF